MQKVALFEVFHDTAKRKFIEKLADMFDRFADTATRLDFTKIVPRKFHLGFRSCQFLIYPLVWMAPLLKENQQLLQ